MQKPFANVQENVMIYDTVAIFNDTNKSFSNPSGWFQNYAQMGAANSLSFFNVRNREVGTPYNNQDSRDQMPYAFRCRSIGVSFFANTFTQAPTWAVDYQFSPEDAVGHLFQVDLPRHASVTFRVQQDDRLKTHPYFVPPGYGPYGSGYGRGSPYLLQGNTLNDGYDHTAGVVTQGSPELGGRWPFPIPIDIPRRGTIEVKVEFNEYARQLLQTIPMGYEWQGVNDTVDDIEGNPVFAGIQVSLGGERLVQQRGQYHV